MRKTIHCHNLDGTTIYQTIQVDDGHKWNGHKVWVDENGNRSYVLRKMVAILKLGSSVWRFKIALDKQ